MKRTTKEAKERISEFLELPKDIMLDLPRITMVGNLELYIENHRGIVEYSKVKIRINTKSGMIKITGRDLYIKTVITEEIILCGNIENIEFIE